MNLSVSRLELPAPCPDCGLGFMEFRHAGRLGCAGDYQSFREQLRPLIEQLHRSATHTGKRPARWRGSVEQFAEHRRLRRDLATAVAQCAYEKAAELRDALKLKDQQNGL